MQNAITNILAKAANPCITISANLTIKIDGRFPDLNLIDFCELLSVAYKGNPVIKSGFKNELIHAFSRSALALCKLDKILIDADIQIETFDFLDYHIDRNNLTAKGIINIVVPVLLNIEIGDITCPEVTTALRGSILDLWEHELLTGSEYGCIKSVINTALYSNDINTTRSDFLKFYDLNALVIDNYTRVCVTD
jgi:hypothetical protein